MCVFTPVSTVHSAITVFNCCQWCEFCNQESKTLNKVGKFIGKKMINQVAEALYSATYVENYLDYVENLPNDVQRHLSRIREIDVEYRGEFYFPNTNASSSSVGIIFLIWILCSICSRSPEGYRQLLRSMVQLLDKRIGISERYASK